MELPADRKTLQSAPSVIWLAIAMLGLAGVVPSAFAAHRAGHVPGLAESTGLTAPYAAECVLEPVTGTVIVDQNMHKTWPLASVTKMMLMLIVAEKLHDGSLKLTDQISTSAKAAKMGGSQVYLKEGESFSLDDMMKAIVVHSANDASVAVAEYIAGSTEAFVVMMNQEAERLKLNDTHYYSVHGLPPAPDQSPDVSSAYDCAMLARELVKYPDVLRWSAIDTAPFRNGTFVLRNTNHLVRTFNGCDGLKTGFYDRAGFNVVATAHRGGLRLIAVVLGSPRKGENFDQAAVLLSEGFAQYEMYQVAHKGEPLNRSIAVRGASVSTIKPVWGEDVALFLKRSDDKSQVKIAYELPASVSAPLAEGQQLGVARVMLDGRQVAAPALLAPGALTAGGSLFHRLLGAL
ncbi:MAG TPA: D-alanyl-D-alanine carboxypeptidase family protein [Candidatus Binataceae bacterium]|nr:D-alanyl-D-alanine carboxypeptidase family protein [Candidatus Binataceae bacterium]